MDPFIAAAFLDHRNFQMLYHQYVQVRVNPEAAVTRTRTRDLSVVEYTFLHYAKLPFKSQGISHQVPRQKLYLSLIKYVYWVYLNMLFN